MRRLLIVALGILAPFIPAAGRATPPVGPGTVTVIAPGVVNGPAVPVAELWAGNAISSYGVPAHLRAALTTRGGAGISGRTIAFTVDGAPAGSAFTDASGHAQLAYGAPVHAGVHAIRASFAGGGGFPAAAATASLDVVRTLTVLHAGGGYHPLASGTRLQTSGHLWAPGGTPAGRFLINKLVRLTVAGAPTGSARTQHGSDGLDGYYELPFFSPALAEFETEVRFDGDADYLPSVATAQFSTTTPVKMLSVWIEPLTSSGPHQVGETVPLKVVVGTYGNGESTSGPPTHPVANVEVNGMFTVAREHPSSADGFGQGISDAQGRATVLMKVIHAGTGLLSARITPGAYDTANFLSQPRRPFHADVTTAAVSVTAPASADAGATVPFQVKVTRRNDGVGTYNPQIITPTGAEVSGDNQGTANFNVTIPTYAGPGPVTFIVKVKGDDQTWPAHASAVIQVRNARPTHPLLPR